VAVRSGVDTIVTSITDRVDQRRSGRIGVVVKESASLRQPAELLPWALLSVAALVLSASAADALRKGVAQPAEAAPLTGEAVCAPAAAANCPQHPARYTLEADAFALDSAELPKDLKRPLDAVAEALRQQGATAVRIEVHTDASGPAEARRTLTQRRAEAIKLYLIERGVDAASLHAVGMGSLVTRRGADPYAGANRRVEIVRL
jgi:OmpA-OmpF porin, OOP family